MKSVGPALVLFRILLGISADYSPLVGDPIYRLYVETRRSVQWEAFDNNSGLGSLG